MRRKLWRAIAGAILGLALTSAAGRARLPKMTHCRHGTIHPRNKLSSISCVELRRLEVPRMCRPPHVSRPSTTMARFGLSNQCMFNWYSLSSG